MALSFCDCIAQLTLEAAPCTQNEKFHSVKYVYAFAAAKRTTQRPNASTHSYTSGNASKSLLKQHPPHTESSLDALSRGVQPPSHFSPLIPRRRERDAISRRRTVPNSTRHKSKCHSPPVINRLGGFLSFVGASLWHSTTKLSSLPSFTQN